MEFVDCRGEIKSVSGSAVGICNLVYAHVYTRSYLRVNLHTAITLISKQGVLFPGRGYGEWEQDYRRIYVEFLYYCRQGRNK